MPIWLRMKRRDAIRKSQLKGLPQRAIDAFMRRDRYNANELKPPEFDLPKDKELQGQWLRWATGRMFKLPVSPPIWKKMRLDQRICFLLGVKFRRFAFWNDMGTGKTLLGISLARYFGKAEDINRVMVLVPRRTNKGEWADQIRTHSPGSTYVVLPKRIEDKWKAVEGTDARFIIETYAGFLHMVCTLKKKKKRGKRDEDDEEDKGPKRMVPSLKLVKRLSKCIQGIIPDESHHLANKKSLAWRIVRKLLSLDDKMIFFPLSGTPFGRDPTPLWSQMRLVDDGHTLGETLALFRGIFFRPSIKEMGTVEYNFDKSTDALLHRCMAHRSIRFTCDDGRPGVQRARRNVILPSSAESHYQAAVEQLAKARGNYQACQNAFLRLRQISSGFLGYKDDDTGAKAQFEFPDNPKLEALLTMCEGIAYEHKTIIFYDFTYSGLRIKRELEEIGKEQDIGKVLMLYGGTKNPEAVMDEWARNDDARTMVLQNKYGIGLDRLKIARYGIFYESPVSCIERVQCERRIDRQHSPFKSVHLIDCIVRDTVDEQILALHKEGRDLFQALIEGKIHITPRRKALLAGV